MKSRLAQTGSLIVLLAAIALVVPRILGPYDLRVMTLALISAIMALSLNFSLGYVGQPNFGQAMLFGMGAYASGILSTRFGVSFPTSIASAALAGMAAAVLFGPIVLRLRDAYFCMVTIALAQTLMLVSNNTVGLTGGPMGLPGIPPGTLFGKPLGTEGFFVVALMLLALGMFVTYRLEHSVVGRAWVGMRDSETLARSIGVNTYYYAVLSFVIGGAFAGIAGGLSAHFATIIDPKVFAFELSSMAVVGAVLGGSGTLWGPVVGALLVSLLPEYLRLAAMWRLPIFGLFLVIVVVLMPRGLVPTLGDLVRRGRQGGAGPGKPARSTPAAPKATSGARVGGGHRG